MPNKKQKSKVCLKTKEMFGHVKYLNLAGYDWIKNKYKKFQTVYAERKHSLDHVQNQIKSTQGELKGNWKALQTLWDDLETPSQMTFTFCRRYNPKAFAETAAYQQ